MWIMNVWCNGVGSDCGNEISVANECEVECGSKNGVKDARRRERHKARGGTRLP